jgi:hypothetical protein
MCEATFLEPGAGCFGACGAGEICVANQSGDVGQDKCVANPGGCVPSDPCSPACAALCGNGMVCKPTCDGIACSDPATCWIGEKNCGSDEKCAPYDALGKDTFNGTKCVPVDPEPDGLGQPCTAEGKTGIDSCVEGALCFKGVCTRVCGGFSDICDDGYACAYFAYPQGGICRATCSPLAPLCAADEVCVPNSSGEGSRSFFCVNDASGDLGAAGDLCAYLNACDPGLMCVQPGFVPGCAVDNTGCCTSFCDLMAPEGCLPGQSCVPYFDEPEPEFPTLGLCVAL